MEFRLLGPVEFGGPDRWIRLGRRQERSVLAILLLSAGRPVPTERLIDLVWAGPPPADARAALRAHASRLRLALGQAAGEGVRPPSLTSRDGGYLLAADPDSIDALRFDAMVDRAQQLDQPAHRGLLLREALGLWRGPALADIGPPGVRERLVARLVERRQRALHLRIDADLADGRHADLIGELSELVAGEPLDENLVTRLMLALYRDGRQRDSLDAFQALRERMRADLGLDPGDQVRDLHAAILRADPALRVDPGPDGDRGPGRSPRPDNPADAEPATPRRFLPRDIGDFVGREALLGRIVGQPAGTGPVILLDGMPGVGKTTIAVHAAHLLADRHPDGQLAIDLRGHSDDAPVRPAEALAALLVQLGVPLVRMPEDLDGRMLVWRAWTAGRRLVLLLDNAASSEQILPLLPTGDGCVTLVTSRRRLAGVDGALCLPVEPLSEQEAVTLLGRVVGTRSELDQEATTQVARHCGYLPLAVRLSAARLVHRPGWTMRDLAGLISSARGALRESAVEGRTVEATFTLSYQQLSDPARAVFCLLALHPGADQDIGAAAALAGRSVADTREWLDTLLDNHLLDEPTQSRYRMHDLLREYARRRAELDLEPAARQAARRRLFDHYLDAATPRRQALETVPATLAGDTVADEDTDLSQAIAWFETERANIVACVRLAESHGFDREAWQLAHSLWRFAYLRDYTTDLVSTQEIAVRCADRTGDPRAAAVARNYFAAAQVRQGNLDRALELLRSAEEWIRKVPDPVFEYNIVRNAASVLHLSGRFAQALECARSGARLAEEIDNPFMRAQVYLSIALSLQRLGRHREALDLTAYALEIIETHDLDSLRAKATGILGTSQMMLGADADARRNMRTSVDLFHRYENESGARETLHNLALLERLHGNFEAALRMLREVLASAGEAAAKEDECQVRNSLGETLLMTGAADEAYLMHRRALEMATRYGLGFDEGRALAGLGDAIARHNPSGARHFWLAAHRVYARLRVAEQHAVAAKLSGSQPGTPPEPHFGGGGHGQRQN